MESNKQVEKNKVRLLKFLVIIVVIIIAIFWLISLSSSWQVGRQEKTNLNSLREELGERLDNLDSRLIDLEQEQVEIIKKLNDTELNKDNLINQPDLIDLIIGEDGYEGEGNDLEDLNDGLMDDNDSMNLNSTELSDDHLKWQVANCPQWINCMPMVDGPTKTCQIPVGCEGYTQIAY